MVEKYVYNEYLIIILLYNEYIIARRESKLEKKKRLMSYLVSKRFIDDLNFRSAHKSYLISVIHIIKPSCLNLFRS